MFLYKLKETRVYSTPLGNLATIKKMLLETHCIEDVDPRRLDIG